MKTIFILMDSLNRHCLNIYENSSIKTPNIERLAKKGVVFDQHFCGSMPCVPARRDLMTGKLNFMESPWGPIEPWDDCLPVELYKRKGTYSHMITDHHHYFHSGGEAYHTLFNTYEFIRGQAGDNWHPLVKKPVIPKTKGKARRQHWVNREFMDVENENDYSTPQCFQKAIEFLENNGKEDNWHLHLEVFDPHEPFMCPKEYRDLYDDKWHGDYYFDWPNYAPVEEDEEAVLHIQKRYAGVLTMTDKWLGHLLDKVDEMNLWEDTAIILTSDHGHLLGEHGYWAKNYMFDYKELVHIPLIIYLPGRKKEINRVSALTTTIDLMPTIMELHNTEAPNEVQGKSILHLVEGRKTDNHHEGVLYGYFGKDINMYDGTYTYSCQPLVNSKAYHHTAMPRGYNDFISKDILRKSEVGVFLNNTHDIPHFRIEVDSIMRPDRTKENLIYNIIDDPTQENPIKDKLLEENLKSKMAKLMIQHQAPKSEFYRVGLGNYNN